MALSFKQLRYFLGVADCGQISAAARNMNVSQSTITVSIKELETDLGVLLFDRHPQGLKLTYMGEVFLKHAKDVVSSVELARNSVTTMQDEISGTIRIGMTHVLSGYYYFPRARQFRRRYPKIELNITEMKRETLEKSILEGEIDLGLVITSNVGNLDKFEIKTFHSAKRNAWLSSSHILFKKDQLSIHDLVQFPYVLLNADDCEEASKSYWDTVGTFPASSFRTTSIEAVRSSVSLGSAVTILSDVLYRPWSLDGGRVERKPIVEDLPTMDLGFVWEKGRQLSEAEIVFQKEFFGNED